jgi:hypothetical protein
MNSPRTLLAIQLALVLALPQGAHAVDRPQICSSQNLQGTALSPAAQYCVAGDSAMESSKSQQAAGLIQAGVAAICLTSCASSFTTGGLADGWCNGAAVAGTIFTIAKAKETSERMTQLLGLAGPGLSIFNNGFAETFDVNNPFGKGSNQYSVQTAAETAGTKAAEGGREAFYQAKVDQAVAAKNQTLGQGSEMDDAAEKAFRDQKMAEVKKDSALKADADKAGNEAGQKAADEKKSRASCLTAALSSVQSVMSYDGAKSSKKAAEENYASVRQLEGEFTTSVGMGSNALEFGTTGSVGGAAGTGFVRRVVRNDQGPSVRRERSACNDTSTFSGNLNCALSQPGNTLPPFVSNPEFPKLLERLSGGSADRLTRASNATSAMQASLAKALTPTGQERLGSLISGINVSNAEAGSAYVGGGGGRRGSSKESSFPDVNSLLDKLLPAEGGGEPQGEQLTETVFNQGRLIASQAGDEDDRRLSLFVRVSSRYRLSRDRLSSRQMNLEAAPGLLQQR